MYYFYQKYTSIVERSSLEHILVVLIFFNNCQLTPDRYGTRIQHCYVNESKLDVDYTLLEEDLEKINDIRDNLDKLISGKFK